MIDAHRTQYCLAGAVGFGGAILLNRLIHRLCPSWLGPHVVAVSSLVVMGVDQNWLKDPVHRAPVTDPRELTDRVNNWLVALSAGFFGALVLCTVADLYSRLPQMFTHFQELFYLWSRTVRRGGTYYFKNQQELTRYGNVEFLAWFNFIVVLVSARLAVLSLLTVRDRIQGLWEVEEPRLIAEDRDGVYGESNVPDDPS